MTTNQYTEKVRVGLLLELPIDAEQLHLSHGDNVRIQVDHVVGSSQTGRVNEGMLAALREIAERQQGRRYTDGTTTDTL